MKGWYYRNKYLEVKRSVLAIQRYGRGFIARQQYAKAMENHKAIEIQRYCRGYLARKHYNVKIMNIVKAQACVRRFLAKRKFKKLKAEAKAISHLQTKYKGLENKIIELQQKCDISNKENLALKTQVATIPELRMKVEAFKNIENELKMVKLNMSEKEDQIISVQKSLDRERDEKMALIEEKNKEDKEWLIERNHWVIERQELKQQLNEMIEMTKNDKNARLSEVETNEINLAYHKVIKDKESLENENALLKQEIKRLQMIIANPHELDLMKHNMLTNDEDFGYSSSRNTLEKQHRHASSVASSQLSEGDFLSLQHHSNAHNNHSTTATLERKLKNFFGFSNREGRKFLSYILKPLMALEKGKQLTELILILDQTLTFIYSILIAIEVSDLMSFLLIS